MGSPLCGRHSNKSHTIWGRNQGPRFLESPRVCLLASFNKPRIFFGVPSFPHCIAPNFIGASSMRPQCSGHQCSYPDEAVTRLPGTAARHAEVQGSRMADFTDGVATSIEGHVTGNHKVPKSSACNFSVNAPTSTTSHHQSS